MTSEVWGNYSNCAVYNTKAGSSCEDKDDWIEDIGIFEVSCEVCSELVFWENEQFSRTY